MTKQFERRLIDHPAPTPQPTPCRLWQGALRNGYGHRTIGTRQWYQHRWVAAQVLGADAIKGRVVRHKCDNKLCYRFDHLEIGTHADNSADRESRGRGNQPKGEANAFAKLTESDIPRIRALVADGESQRSVARRYGVNHKTIGRIIHNEGWRHIP